MARIKGTKVTSKLAYVRDVHGEDAAQAVLGALPREDRRRVSSVLEIGWYPQELYERLLVALVDGVGGGDERELDRVGAHSAERQSRGAYSVYFRGKNPGDLLEGMPSMHAMLNDPGEMRVERRRDGHVTLLVGSPRGEVHSCRVARAFYRRAVELCGGREVTVREVECSGRDAPACRFEIRWQ